MTRLAVALRRGDRIHVAPHDVFRFSDKPVPAGHCPDADITVAGVVRECGWAVVVICWMDGTAERCTTYDADQPFELVSAA